MSRRLVVAVVLALAALAVGVAVGRHAAGSSGGGTRTGAGSTAQATSLAAGAGIGTTATGLTQPQVALAPTTSTPASKLPGHGRRTIYLGDMNTPEQFVLGALYQAALAQQGFAVSLSRNVGTTEGPTAEAQEALKQGVLDLYPQYLDTWDSTVAGQRQHFASEKAAYAAAAAYAKRHGYDLLTPTPGSDTAGFAVTTQFARESHLRSLGQLARAEQLSFGIPLDFTGLPAIEHAYAFSPGVVQNVDIGSQFGELTRGDLQVAYVSTTDPQLSGQQFTLLRDPKHVFGFGNIVPVTTPAVVRAEGQAFVRTIDRVDRLLTTTALQGLNSEEQMHSQTTVAIDFLQGNGILPPPRYVVTPR